MAVTKSNHIPEVIETDRLLIRRPDRADSRRYEQALSEPVDRLEHCFGIKRRDRSGREQVTQMIDDAIKSFMCAEELTYLVFDKRSEILIGWVCLAEIDWSVRKGVIEFFTRVEFRDQGYEQEYLNAIHAMIMETLHFQRIELRVDPRNANSVRQVSRLAYCLEGRLRNYACDADGRGRDLLIYSMTPDDYFQVIDFRPGIVTLSKGSESVSVNF